ncbi:hypothetical protein PENSPDRAFT_646411 [Peniophora sp. CONT]|nr:hypothetical protein PENSPDRAFT_646411 [Peniophora sp. CONT]
MDNWQGSLHSGFLGEHILVKEIRLTSFSSFLWAALVTFLICAMERVVTIALARHWTPFVASGAGRRARLQVALWRTALYWVATLLRMFYMLIAMSFHIGLLLVMVTTLAAGQFLIEYTGETSEPSMPSRHGYRRADMEPLMPNGLTTPSLEDGDSFLAHPHTKAGSRPIVDLHYPPRSGVPHDMPGLPSAISTSALPDTGAHWGKSEGGDVRRETHHRTSSQAWLMRGAPDEDSDGEV